MNTNQKFICYAKESFDGKPVDYGVEFYEGEEAPNIDVTTPDIVLVVLLEGKMSNPFDVQQLTDWCDEHDLELVDDDVPFYETPEYQQSFESMSATEANPFSRLATKFRMRGSSSADQLDDIFKRNTESIENSIKSKTMKSTPMSEEDAVAYYINYLLANNPDNPPPYYVLVAGETTRSSADITQGVPLSPLLQSAGMGAVVSNSQAVEKERQKLSLDAANKMLSNIKRARFKDSIIVGYTFVQSVVNDFKQEASPDSDYTLQNTPQELNEAWSEATSAVRYQILKSLMKDGGVTELPTPVVEALLKSKAPFNSLLGRITLSQLKIGKGIDEKVVQALSRSQNLQTTFDRYSIEGVDFSTPNQVAIINFAGSLDRKIGYSGDQRAYLNYLRYKGKPQVIQDNNSYVAAAMKGGKPFTLVQLLRKNNKWAPLDDMQKIYQDVLLQVETLIEDKIDVSSYGPKRKEESEGTSKKSANDPQKDVEQLYKILGKLVTSNPEFIKDFGNKQGSKILSDAGLLGNNGRR